MLLIYQRKHSHPIDLGTSCAFIERLKKLVSTFVNFNRGSGPQNLQMVLARKLLFMENCDKLRKTYEVHGTFRQE